MKTKPMAVILGCIILFVSFWFVIDNIFAKSPEEAEYELYNENYTAHEDKLNQLLKKLETFHIDADGSEEMKQSESAFLHNELLPGIRSLTEEVENEEYEFNDFQKLHQKHLTYLSEFEQGFELYQLTFTGEEKEDTRMKVSEHLNRAFIQKTEHAEMLLPQKVKYGVNQ